MSDGNSKNQNQRLAGGAGYVFLGRMGAIIEALSIIAFTWFYGAEIFGLFAALWSYVKVSTAFSEMAMTTTLQRYVPKIQNGNTDDIAGHAIKFSVFIALIIAVLGTITAPIIATILNAADAQESNLVEIIRIYIWVLPFWTFVEVSTAAIRATRTFGPEIKVRIFYEQGIRLLAAILFALMGFLTFGLFLAHLVSVIITSLIAIKLLSRYYSIKALIKAPMFGTLQSEMRQYGYSVMPSNMIKKLFSEFPVILLNLMLPGAAGAMASGYYAVARKIASVLQGIRITFEYVMAPLAAERDGVGDRRALQDMYAFATRLSLALALPFGAALYLAAPDVLSAMKPEFTAAFTAIICLIIGRMLEASTGPASAIVEMLGHRLLPAINGLTGIAALYVIGYYLIPEHGVTGAAVGAAIGMNVTALLNLIQARVIFKLSPYSLETLKPLGFALLGAAFIGSLTHLLGTVPSPFGFITAALALIASLFMIFRFGFHDDDLCALGKFGRFIKPSLKAKNKNIPVGATKDHK
ncbi:lipopolysaccharide biosynthesis protein [Kordiimonas sp. SCSIO 12610]|uniref:lipopolysaccharide biosynthesis protein n=1 Tax=Kordiimonas sp. SCSIO 12610 TaxID=2829597 RepID=UPI00210A8F58|nr:polysaccharide biosynthesis C-terminal domain-containing protein [Kordiimonas sp. SCSIO 12610]UTW56611.1 polysaccharide biosynthesis C-terminal domain-containing protein [Kordiimonas sp. SCSIO 12610]